MCHSASYGTSKIEYKIEVIAPCGEVIMIKNSLQMRGIDVIDGALLIKNARLFFRELGFSGDDWKVRVTKKTFIANNHSFTENIVEKVFC